MSRAVLRSTALAALAALTALASVVLVRVVVLVLVLALVLTLGGMSRAHAAGPALPVRVERGRLVVVAEAGLAQEARLLAVTGERALTEIADDLGGLPAVDRVEARLVIHAEDLAAVAPPGRGAPPWAVGVAYSDVGVVIVAARGRRGELLDMKNTLAHELAHVALGRALGALPGSPPPPRWLNEGFAYLHSSDFSWERAQTLFSAVLGGRVPSIHELDAAFPAEENEVALAYALAYDFVGFLASRGAADGVPGDRAAFRRFLAELARGAGLDAAARTAYARSLGELEREWLERLRERYLWLPAGTFGMLVWGFTALLLVLAWLRRRHQKRLRLRRMELEETIAEAALLRERDLLN